MRVALIQMVSSSNVEFNLERASELVSEAGRAGVDVIFLPENFASLGHSNPREVAKRESSAQGPIRVFLSEAAVNAKAWLFAGTMPMIERPDGSPASDGRVRAASLVIDPSGAQVARYDKIHMFDVEVSDQHKHYRESETFEHGDELQTVLTPWAKVGLSVCYDLRFSELYLSLLKQGVEIITVPSAFTVPTGEAHFEVLLRARAIESFAFMVAACQGGNHDSGRETYGHSMVVNPWGEVVAKAGLGEHVLIADLDVSEVREARRKMPVIDQRQL